MRRRYKLKKRALIVDSDKGLLILPSPELEDEMGSLKGLFNETARGLLRDARKKDKIREKLHPVPQKPGYCDGKIEKSALF
jgi:hypothetical protein